MPRYLSPQWLDAAREAVRRADVARFDDVTLALTQVVTDGPDGDVTYHVAMGGGRATFGPGPARNEDVRLVQHWDTAVALARGELHASDAFLRGHVRLHGDATALVRAAGVFPALDAALAPVRAETTYG